MEADIQAEQTRDLMFRKHEIEIAFHRIYTVSGIGARRVYEKDFELLASELGIADFYRSIK